MEKAPLSYVRMLRTDSAMGAVIKDMKRKGMGDRRDQDTGYLIDRDAEEYEDILPTFNGMSFGDHLTLRMRESLDPISILDIGCGKAKFLRELKEAHPEIGVSGLSVTDLRTEEDDGITTPWEDVDYRIGDMHRIEKLFHDKKFDFIVSVWALFHSGDPLDVVKQTYQLLKPGGIAFLQSPNISLSPQERNRLIQFWKCEGITVELHGGLDELATANQNNPRHVIEDLYDLSFERSATPKMHMPFSYNTRSDPRFSDRTYILNLK